MINPLNQIIVQCPRENTTHMQITAFTSGLLVEHGKIIHGLSMRFLRVGDKERLPFSDNPELFDLYDGHGWNIEELSAFVNMMGNIDIDEQLPVIVAPA